VAEKTGITAAMLRSEKPLSAVFPDFLQWISITTQKVSERSNASHYPGTLY